MQGGCSWTAELTSIILMDDASTDAYSGAWRNLMFEGDCTWLHGWEVCVDVLFAGSHW